MRATSTRRLAARSKAVARAAASSNAASARSTASRASSSAWSSAPRAASAVAAARATRWPVVPPSQSGTASCTPAFQSVVASMPGAANSSTAPTSLSSGNQAVRASARAASAAGGLAPGLLDRGARGDGAPLQLGARRGRRGRRRERGEIGGARLLDLGAEQPREVALGAVEGGRRAAALGLRAGERRFGAQPFDLRRPGRLRAAARTRSSSSRSAASRACSAASISRRASALPKAVATRAASACSAAPSAATAAACCSLAWQRPLAAGAGVEERVAQVERALAAASRRGRELAGSEGVDRAHHHRVVVLQTGEAEAEDRAAARRAPRRRPRRPRRARARAAARLG